MPLFTANIVLKGNTIVVSATSALQGVKAGKNYKYGRVEMIYRGCMETFIDTTVMYNADNEISIYWNGHNYFMIKETDIIFEDSILVS